MIYSYKKPHLGGLLKLTWMLPHWESSRSSLDSKHCSLGRKHKISFCFFMLWYNFKWADGNLLTLHVWSLLRCLCNSNLRGLKAQGSKTHLPHTQKNTNTKRIEKSKRSFHALMRPERILRFIVQVLHPTEKVKALDCDPIFCLFFDFMFFTSITLTF